MLYNYTVLFFSRTFLAARISDSLAGFYTGLSPDVQWQIV